MCRCSLFRGGVQGAPNPIIIEFDSIVHSAENRVLKIDGDNILLSEDYGDTYVKYLNYKSVLNRIRFTHIFSNGRVLLADDTKCAYTDINFENLTLSDVRDLNGNTFAPQLTFDNFTTVNGTDVQKSNSGKEVFMWGNYNNNENSNGITVVQPQRAYVWYTEDYGETIRCIYQFGVTIPVGKTQPLICRHVHGVTYNPLDNTFWICVGDEPREINSHWIRANWNEQANTFTFTWIGSGDKYKSSNLCITGGYIYASLDISGGGLIRIPYAQASDVTKFEDLKVGLNDILFIAVKNNEAIIVQSRFLGEQEGRRFWYSPNITQGVSSYYEILGDMPEGYTDRSIYARVFNPNTRGNILTGVQEDFIQGWDQYTYIPSFWLDRSLAKNGFPNAFK